MATRQRGRASTKTATSAGGTQQTPTAGAPLAPAAIELPPTLTDNVSDGEDRSTASDVKFVGEELTYKSRYERIAESAYGFAQARGFAPGGEIEDWLRAEREIDALLGSGDERNDRID